MQLHLFNLAHSAYWVEHKLYLLYKTFSHAPLNLEIWATVLWKCLEFSVNTPWKPFNGPWKLQNVISCVLFWPWIFHENVAFYFMTHEFDKEIHSWAMNLPWNSSHYIFHGPWKSCLDFHGPWKWLVVWSSISWAINNPWNSTKTMEQCTVTSDQKINF